MSFVSLITTMSRKYYAVQCGRRVGVFDTWDKCSEQVIGFSGSVFKSFADRRDAEQFARGTGGYGKSAKRSTEHKHRAHPYGVRSVSEKEQDPTRTVVWTDGSSINNGKSHARAGVGVYFGPDDTRNLSEPLEGPRQTNQRAEITVCLLIVHSLPPLTLYPHIKNEPNPQAAIRAIEIASVLSAASLEIRTDSKYVCDGMELIDDDDMWLTRFLSFSDEELDSQLAPNTLRECKECRSIPTA